MKNFQTTKFQEKVYSVLKKIPKGQVSTYGAIAKVLGNKSYRAVGNALNKNPYSPKVPCHRVVKSNGEVGGFAHGTRKKIEMLRKEGITINRGKVDLKKFGIKD